VIIAGIQRKMASFIMTFKPQLEKKDFIPIGETPIGVTGKKYLVLSNGEKRAIPRPPFVRASRIPWLAVIRKK